MLKLFFSTLLFATAFSFSANAQTSPTTLSFQQGTLTAELTWAENSPVVGPESKMQVQWRDAAGQPVDLAGDFRVVLFMPDMGHGSSPTKIAKPAETVGLYKVSKIYFTMPGLWEVRVILRLTGMDPEMQYTSLQMEPQE